MVAHVGRKDSIYDVLNTQVMDPLFQCSSRKGSNYGITIQATRPKELLSIGQSFAVDVLVQQRGRAGTRLRALPSSTLQVQVVEDEYFQHTVSPLFTLGEDGEAWVSILLSPFPGSQLKDLRPYYTLTAFDPESGDVVYEGSFENVVSDFVGGLVGKGSACGTPNLYIKGWYGSGKSSLVSLIAQTLGWVDEGVALELHARSTVHVTRDLNLYDAHDFGPNPVSLNFRLASGYGMDEDGLRGLSLQEYLSGEWLAGRKLGSRPTWFQRVRARWVSRSSRAAHAYCFVMDWEEVVRDSLHMDAIAKVFRMIRDTFPHLDPVVVVTHADTILPELAEEDYYSQYSGFKKTVALRVHSDLGVPLQNVFVLTPVVDDSGKNFAKYQGAVMLLERLLAMADTYCKTRR